MMRKLICSGTVFLIAIIILVVSIILGERLNPMFWWQVIGVAIITFDVGLIHVKQLKAYKKHKN